MPQYQQYPSRREIATQERQARKEQEHAMRASRHQEVMYTKQQRHQQHSMQRQPSPRRSTTSFSPRASYDALPSSYMQAGATSPRGGAVRQVSAGRSPDPYRDPQYRGGTSGSGTGEMYRGDVYRSGDSYQRTNDPYRSGDPYGSTGGHSGYAQPVRQQPQQPQRYAEPPQQQQAYRREEGGTGDGAPREEKSGSSFLSKFGGKVQKMFNVNKNAGTRDASSLQGRPSQDGSQGGRRHSSGGGGYPPPGHVRTGSNTESVGAAAALQPQQPPQQQPSLAVSSGPIVVQPRAGGGGGGPIVVQPKGGGDGGGAPAGHADLQQVHELQQRIASLEVQLSQSEAQRKAADAKGGAEWRDKWNYQNFKLNLLVDMLVLRVLDLDDGDSARTGGGGGGSGGGGGPRLIKRAPPPPDVAEAELREDSIEDY